MGDSPLSVYQGIVVSVEGVTCTVRFGNMDVSGIRLRASETEDESQILLVPKENTAVIVGSLSGDYTQMVVLSVDVVQRIEINGGKLGGLINIEEFTKKINELVDAFNKHTHTIPASAIECGPYPNSTPVSVPAVAEKASRLNEKDYEDETVKH